ncbi:hypothetical protein ABZ819_05220 [Streptomyces venezuelae]|uniref:hypothetical protein n=1 Tax=Streptomyces venezuelae TaxID=54571 RepID=UPI00341D22BC
MAAPTIAKPPTREEDPQHSRTRALAEQMHNPGLYAGAGLGLASTTLTGDPLLLTALGSTSLAAGWTALGMHPGPWRWLPGHGEPWQWMCRAGNSSYRRSVRRMRTRLATPANNPAVTGLFVVGVCDGWRSHPHRPALARSANIAGHRVRCTLLNQAWQHALPDWGTAWWRRYSLGEMALRTSPLLALPAVGATGLPWWGSMLAVSAGAGWGARMWRRPAPGVQAVEAPKGADWYRARWAEWIACERGPLPESKLASLELDDDKLTAVIVSTTAKAADSIEQNAVSIAFDVPPRAVNIYRPDDMPANRAKLTVRLRALTPAELDESDLQAVWDEYNPYAGSKLITPATTEFGRSFQIEMPRKGAGVKDVTADAIAQALGLAGEDATARLHLRVLDALHVEVNEMTRNPLQGGVALDLDALTMDEHGYITVGKDIYGAPARWRLLKYDPKRRGLSGQPSASPQHSFGSGTTGAGKTSLEEDLQIAQRKNGFISWLADGKGGAGYASWFHDLDWLVKSFFGATLMGQAATAVSDYRYAEQMKLQWLDEEGYTENGRSFFVAGDPFKPLAVTWDEFNEMILKDPRAPHVQPLLSAVSSVGRLSRAAGISARIWVQIPNLDAIGSNASANAIRDMLQSGNIALFRTARSDVDIMSLGSRTPEFRLAPLPERFPDGSATEGLFYIADGKAQYTASRAMFHSNPARISRQFPLHAISQEEADAACQAGPAGLAYLRRDEYRHLDAGDEDAFLRELVAKTSEQNAKHTQTIDLAPGPTPADDADDDDLDDIVPPSRSELVWHAVHDGARRNKQIAEATDLKPTNVANATARLERLGKLEKIQQDWHTTEPLDTEPISA